MAHVSHYKRSALGNIYNHLEREKDKDGNYIKFANQNINPELTHLNFKIKNKGGKKFVTDRLKQVDKVDKRKSLNVMSSWVITLPKELDYEEHGVKFFNECYNFMANRYGAENVGNGYVHLDEVTPHIHIDMVCATKDNAKVCTKEVINRADLRTFHTDLEAHLESVFNFKVPILNGQTKGFKTVEQMKEHTALSKENEKIRQNNAELKKINDDKLQENIELSNKNKDLKIKNDALKNNNAELDAELEAKTFKRKKIENDINKVSEKKAPVIKKLFGASDFSFEKLDLIAENLLLKENELRAKDIALQEHIKEFELERKQKIKNQQMKEYELEIETQKLNNLKDKVSEIFGNVILNTTMKSFIDMYFKKEFAEFEIKNKNSIVREFKNKLRDIEPNKNSRSSKGYER